MQSVSDPMPLAQAALLWLLADPERVGGFLGASGLELADMKARVADPAFLGFVLDFLMSEDSWVLSFSEESGFDPASVASARARLPGGDAPFWT